MSAQIYLDYQATTPLAEEALAAMMPYLGAKFGNPHSSTHRFGWEAEAAVEAAREPIAELVGAAPGEIIFTSGATEANNLALIGTMTAPGQARRRLVTVATEHACVLETGRWLERQGLELTLLGVDSDGLVKPDTLEAALGEDVALVSIMAVNNEIGVVQQLAELSTLAHGAGALFHSDAAQAFGKIPLDVDAMGIDLMSISAHKIYGPKGVGALYCRRGVKLGAHMHGGGQEGVRSGTLSPALAAGFGAAAKLAHQRLDTDLEHVRALWTRFLDRLDVAGVEYRLNGSATHRYFGNLNLSFPGIDGARLLSDLRGFAVSSGAACASAKGQPSYVLAALGVPATLARATLRIGFGRQTTAVEIDAFCDRLIDVVGSQRKEVES